MEQTAYEPEGRETSASVASIMALSGLLVLSAACVGSVTETDSGAGSDAASDTSTNADSLVPETDAALDSNRPPPGDGGATPIEGRAPVLLDFRVEDANRDRVYFDSTEPIRGTSTTGFTISGRSIVRIFVEEGSLGGHYFEADPPFTFWDNNTIRYDGSGDVEDVGGSPVLPFALTYIRNEIEEPATTRSLYVSASVSSSGDGSSEAEAFRTITEAVSALTVPGTTIWVEAGNYGAEEVQLWRMAPTATAEAPIRLIGYRARPGDIDGMYYSYGDGALDASEMPLLDGGDRGANTAMVTTSGKGYIIVRNFQATNYSNGFYDNRERGVIFDNCIAKDIGSAATRGRGFQIVGGARDCRVERSLSINSTLSAFSVQGSFNLLRGNEARADEDGGLSMDYYYTVTAGTTDSILLGNLSRRHRLGSDVWEHGLSLAGDGTGDAQSRYNLVEDHLSVDMGKGLELRHDGSANNVVRNYEYYGLGHGIMIRDGAHDNRVDGAYIHDAAAALSWVDSPETGTGSGYDNVVVNCVFTNVTWFNYLTRPTSGSPEVARNLFANNTYFNASSAGTLFGRDSAVVYRDNEFVGCNFINVAQQGQASGFAFTSCNFFGGFVVDGPGLTSEDPMFTDAPSGDFSLSTASPASVTEGGVEVVDARYDRSGAERTAPYSIGAYERD